MRVKVGDQWFEATIDQPLMVELTPMDRQNLAGMPIDHHYYACFAAEDGRGATEKRAWMEDGAHYPPADDAA